MTILTRRQFLIRFLPAVAAAPLVQYPQATPEPGADTTLNLTKRQTLTEWQITFILATIKEIGRNQLEMWKLIPRPGHIGPEKPRQT